MNMIFIFIISGLLIFTDVFETYTFEKEICIFGYERICKIKRNYKKINNNKQKLSFISELIDIFINFCIDYGGKIPYYTFNMFKNAFRLSSDCTRKLVMNIININQKTLKKIHSIYEKLFKYIPSFDKNKTLLIFFCYYILCFYYLTFFEFYWLL